MLKNILSNWSNFFLSTLGVFILYPYCVRVMGEPQYGVWLLISSITGYFALLQLGVPMANVRFISKYYAKGDLEKVSQIVSTNFLFFSVIGLLVFLAGLVLAVLLDTAFQIPTELRHLARLATIIASANIALSFTFEVFEGMMHALQQFIVFNLIKNVLMVVRIVLTFLILRFENGLFTLAMLLVMGTVLQAIFFYFYIRFKYPEIEIRKRHVHLSTFRQIAGYSIYVLIFQLASRISYNTDAIVIGSFLSVSAIVFFTIANNFIVYSMNFIAGISDAMMPRVSELDALNDRSSLQDMYFKFSRITSFIVLPVCLAFFIYGGDFIAIWMGEKYRIVAGNVLSILTVSQIFFLVQRSAAFPILMGTSNLRFLTLIMIVTGFLNLILSIWWSKFYGLYGVAWGTTFPNLLNTACIIWFMCRTMKIHLGLYCYRGVLLPLSAGIFFLLPALLLRSAFSIDSYFRFILVVSISMIIYIIFLFLFYIDKADKNILLAKIGINFN